MAVRKRLYEDFAFYAEKALFIRTKSQTVEPFVLNRAQRRLLDVAAAQIVRRGYVRIIVLKGRQMGISTFIGGFLFWWVSQRKAQRALVVAHEAPAADNLFQMTRRFYRSLPKVLQPHTEYSNRKELVFDILDSGYRVITAGGDAIARSETVSAAHLSETAFWPKSSAAANYSGLMDTIPNVAGTVVFNESTANGMSGVFYEQWQAASTSRSDFEAVFLPWFWDDGYRLPVIKSFVPTPAEAELAALYGLDNGQLAFRRSKIAEKGPDLFKQEYPNCPEEAFLTTGRPVFSGEQLLSQRAAARTKFGPSTDPDLPWGIPQRRSFMGDVLADDPRGELFCYLPHDPAETYYIGADVGGGVRRDYSVAQVFDSKRRQAAVWRSDRFDPDAFGTVVARLGRHYNEARVIVERNNHGILTNRVVSKDEGYTNYYTETVYDKVSETETEHVGFFTSEKSKPLIVNELRANLRDGLVAVYDAATLDELQAFVVSDNGRLEAEKGSHDDCVMALALTDHINEGTFTPTENQDDWFVKME